MSTVTISPKFQVVIPKEIREHMKLRSGGKLAVIEYNNRIEFIPIRPIKEMCGFLSGIDTNIEREREDRV